MADDILDDDYKLSPCGRLGGMTGVSQGNKFLGEFNETSEALAFVGTRMDEEQFWPNIWWISDHGNYWMIDREGNEILNDGDQQGCPYCGGDCPELDDAADACDGFQGDIDGLCEDDD